MTHDSGSSRCLSKHGVVAYLDAMSEHQGGRQFIHGASLELASYTTPYVLREIEAARLGGGPLRNRAISGAAPRLSRSITFVSSGNAGVRAWPSITFTVVNGGTTIAACSISSKPVIDRSSGTRMPRRRHSSIAPIACRSVPQISTVGGVAWSRKSGPPAAPLEIEGLLSDERRVKRKPGRLQFCARPCGPRACSLVGAFETVAQRDAPMPSLHNQ